MFQLKVFKPSMLKLRVFIYEFSAVKKKSREKMDITEMMNIWKFMNERAIIRIRLSYKL